MKPAAKILLIVALTISAFDIAHATGMPTETCTKAQHATGCAYPYPQCTAGVENSPADTCLETGTSGACPSFSWESCCNRVCQRDRSASEVRKCTDACNGSALTLKYEQEKLAAQR